MSIKPHIFGLKVKQDAEAFEELYKSNYRLAYKYCLRLVKTPSVCEDIVQDVFAYIWKNREVIHIQKSFTSYLLKACHNACVNYFNKERNKQDYIQKSLKKGLYTEDGYSIIYEEEIRSILKDLIEELPDQCRKVFILSREKGLKYKEIAKQLNISPKTVEAQIYRALKYIKQRLKS
ncbi:MAG: RNA polymerase sigma-70 factor [Carboxylicivirga sp.]|jgi:RNA polymerase sigma-70 factor (ECF subfamily)|nr:RNA polymerase sigma-70 factor [Carboxylicivirga sp.]